MVAPYQPADSTQTNALAAADQGLSQQQIEWSLQSVTSPGRLACPAQHLTRGCIPHHLCRRDYSTHGKPWCCCTWWGCCGNCNSGYYDAGCFCARDAHLYWKATYDRGIGRPKYRFYFRSSYLPTVVTAIRSFGKHTEWRDAGQPMICQSHEERGGALCYPKCASMYYGVGPVCWQYCPQGMADCGTYCVLNGQSCLNFLGAVFQDCSKKYPDGKAFVSANAVQLKPVNYILPGVAEKTKGMRLRLDLTAANNTAKQPSIMSTCTRLTCFCKSLPDGAYTNPFKRDTGSYVVCAAGKASAAQCPEDERFNATAGECQSLYNMSPQCLQDPGCLCKGRPNKAYLPYGNNGTVVLCVAGAPTIVTCEPNMEWSRQRQTCVFRAAAMQEPKDPNCRAIECFCQDKLPGMYTDVFSPPNDTVGLLPSYLECVAGKAERKHCPDRHVWDNLRRACIELPTEPQPGNGTTAVYPTRQPPRGPAGMLPWMVSAPGSRGIGVQRTAGAGSGQDVQDPDAAGPDAAVAGDTANSNNAAPVASAAAVQKESAVHRGTNPRMQHSAGVFTTKNSATAAAKVDDAGSKAPSRSPVAGPEGGTN
jgi:hypothetical protein